MTNPGVNREPSMYNRDLWSTATKTSQFLLKKHLMMAGQSVDDLKCSTWTSTFVLFWCSILLILENYRCCCLRLRLWILHINPCIDELHFNCVLQIMSSTFFFDKMNDLVMLPDDLNVYDKYSTLRKKSKIRSFIRTPI